MATTPEGRVKNVIRRVLEENGFARVGTGDYFHKRFYFMPIGGPYSQHGVADYILCGGGRFGALEAKAGYGKQTELQKDFERQVQSAGGMYAVIRNEQDLKEFLDEFLEFKNG